MTDDGCRFEKPGNICQRKSLCTFAGLAGGARGRIKVEVWNGMKLVCIPARYGCIPSVFPNQISTESCSADLLCTFA